jgi:DNA-binding XRE family transcriptional regulator
MNALTRPVDSHSQAHAKGTAMGGDDMRPVDIKQIKAARSLLGWSQEDLAAASTVSISTIKLLESKEGALGGGPETRAKILVALEKAGIQFPDNGLGVQLVPKTKRPPR